MGNVLSIPSRHLIVYLDVFLGVHLDVQQFNAYGYKHRFVINLVPCSDLGILLQNTEEGTGTSLN